MEFLFKSRGAGKRQVKPSQDIDMLADQIAGNQGGDGSSDDSDFKIDDKSSDDEEESDSDDEKSTEDSSNDDSDDDEGKKDSDQELKLEANMLQKHKDLTTEELISLAKKSMLTSGANGKIESTLSEVKVCGCCLGSNSNDANEIVECDGCGISVHEGCYGVSESGSVASTVSSASTEPWFCEPCRAGFTGRDPPPCELCPVLGGVYKETDVGRWVHLVCALYIPGVAFGDPDKMTHITIFEMNYSMWGRKVCNLCASQELLSSTGKDMGITGEARLARTGVCIQCDAGMCKSYFHASCAHAAGFLSEPKYTVDHAHLGEPQSDAYLAHCKFHSDKTVVKKRRRAFLTHLLTSRKRREDIIQRRKVASIGLASLSRTSNKLDNANSSEVETTDVRILRKLNRSRARYIADHIKTHDPWLPTRKLPRLLTTSASAIRKIQRMGELQGIDIERQQRQELQIMAVAEVRKKWHLPPAFNVEYVAYYEDRNNRIQDLKAQVSEDLANHEKYSTEQKQVREKYEVVSKSHEKSLDLNRSLRDKIECYRDVIEKLTTTTQGVSSFPPKEKISCLKPLNRGVEIITPNIKARATVYSQQVKGKGFVPDASQGQINVCAICKKSHDQHLLAHCDTCKLHYHLGCLTPPLTRMPKKSGYYGWSCSECYPDSSDSNADHSNIHEDEGSSDAATQKRNRKRRLAASKALIANSRRNSSDFETEWPTWTVPKSDSKSNHSSSKSDKIHANDASLKISETTTYTNFPSMESSVDKDSGIKNKIKDKKHMISNESTRSLYEAASNAASSLLTSQETTDFQHLDHSDITDSSKAAKAAAKAERKQVKKAEKERRKLEKKKRKILERQQQQMKEAENGSNQDIAVALEDKDQVEDSEDDVEIVEDENGQCTVRIKPKPIKLKIINPFATQSTVPNKPTQVKKRKLSTEDRNSTNGHLNESGQFEQGLPTAKKARQDSESTTKTSVGRPKTPIQRDTRTHCDKCNTDGNNLNLVRCDKCRKCYHFHCLEPPVKKSPKIRGYGWHCFDCDEEVDSDWHLDA